MSTSPKDLDSIEISRIRQEARDAYEEGRRASANPYSKDSIEYCVWNKEWMRCLENDPWNEE